MHGHRRKRALLGALLLTTSLAAAAVNGTNAAAATTTSVTFTVNPASKVGTISPSQLGLSFEYGDLVRGNLKPQPGLVNLLKGLGPGILRIGGNSMDATYYATSPTVAQLQGLRALLDQTGWKVLYSVGMAHFSTTRIAAQAKAAYTYLGSKIFTIACGNEPNVYVQHGLRTTYTFDQYYSELSACYKAVRANAPGVALSGPDTSNGGWMKNLFAKNFQSMGVKVIDQHQYPFNACFNPPTTANDVLQPSVADWETSKIKLEYSMAHPAGLPLRMTENGTVACSGITGISDTFVASLWVADYAFLSAEAGATGIELHNREVDTTCKGYSPICHPKGSPFIARAPYYGALLAHEVGTGSLLGIAKTGTYNVTAHAVQHSTGKISLLLTNKDSSTVKVTVNVPTSGVATTMLMTAPSTLATTGISIQGKTVAADGSFAAAPTAMVTGSNTLTVTLAPYSAEVITLG